MSGAFSTAAARAPITTLTALRSVTGETAALRPMNAATEAAFAEAGEGVPAVAPLLTPRSPGREADRLR